MASYEGTAYEGATIKILNWGKYQVRTDRKKHSWFRLENDFLDSDTFEDYSCGEIMVFLRLCSLASKKVSDRVTVKMANLTRTCRVSEAMVVSAFRKLERDQVIKVSEIYSGVAYDTDETPDGNRCVSPDSLRTYERTNEQTHEPARATTQEVGKPVGEITANAVKKCQDAWHETLRRYGMDRKPLAGEDLKIGRAVQRWGAEAVELAFYGAKHEPASDTFKPGQHMSLDRVLDPEKFERFMNLGVQARKKREAVAPPVAVVEDEPREAALADPVKAAAVKAMLDEAMGRKGGAA